MPPAFLRQTSTSPNPAPCKVCCTAFPRNTSWAEPCLHRWWPPRSTTHWANCPASTAQRGTTAPGVRADPQTVALMSRLFEQMVKDEQLQPAVQSVIAQLQPSVLRVAIHDPRLLRTDKHPAWRFANRSGLVCERPHWPQTIGSVIVHGLRAALVQELAQNTRPQAVQFEEALHKVQNFIELRSQTELQPTQQAVTELAIADQRQALKPILRQQVARQLAATKVTDRVKDFLSGPWVDVLPCAHHGDARP